MVWTDLANADKQHQAVHTDVCVIGAGAAGLYLTMQLVRKGLSVVIIDAGPATCTDGASLGFDPIFERSYYPGATVGRFFGLGGSTSSWGGALVPHTSYDYRPNVAAAEWSHIIKTVSDNGAEVLKHLGYHQEYNFDSFPEKSLGRLTDTLDDCGIHVQSGIYLPFNRKNFTTLLFANKNCKVMPKIFLNAVTKSWATKIAKNNESSIEKVSVVSKNNKELTINADRFVIAAGAIESARIILEINKSGSQPILPTSSAPGCYLADHLSLPIADVVPESLNQVSRLFSPRFSNAWMRSFRFIDKKSQNHPRAFAHFIFSNQSRGFELAKEALRAMQGHRKPSITMADIITGLGDLTMLAYYRFVRSQLYIPPNTPAHLQLDIEQETVRENRISLAQHKDEYGRQVAVVRWEISDRDIANIAVIAKHFISMWPGKKAGLPELKPKLIDSELTKPYDAYHPVGTCRMGDNAEAVVDINLKVRGVKNLWVTSTGVLPSAGTANPTFSMLCLTHKLAGQLADNASKKLQAVS
jgi:choline dehydrogenase-like flavoprotein